MDIILKSIKKYFISNTRYTLQVKMKKKNNTNKDIQYKQMIDKINSNP